MTHMHLYTDGGASPNPGKAGWGFVAVVDGQVLDEHYGHHEHATNNQMELTAAVHALRYAHAHLSGNTSITKITVHADSQYVINGITDWIKGWKAKGFKGVKNADDWRDLDTQVHAITHTDGMPDVIKWVWVRGHNGDKFNERADTLVAKGRAGLASTPFTPGVVPAVPANPRPATPAKTDAALDVSFFGDTKAAILAEARVAGITPQELVRNIVRDSLRITTQS